ncbi:MAG: hypothetical protein ABJN42_09990 [Roseibium sp.]|uniref:hypothetical protein n=1 Tax=Roseibium sp. TaxID=1936156 RepID=UPI003296A523
MIMEVSMCDAEKHQFWSAVYIDSDPDDLQVITVDYQDVRNGEPVDYIDAEIDFSARNGPGMVLGVYPTDSKEEALRLHRAERELDQSYFQSRAADHIVSSE